MKDEFHLEVGDHILSAGAVSVLLWRKYETNLKCHQILLAWNYVLETK
jgi:hypothetical protein